MTGNSDIDAGKANEAPLDEATGKRTLFGRIGGLFGKAAPAALVTPTSEPMMLSESVRIAWDGEPFALKLGKIELEFHPDLSVTGDEIPGDREWIVHSGQAFYEGVPQFIRVAPRQSIVIGRSDSAQKRIFGFDQSVASRHIQVSNHKGDLTLEPLEMDRLTRLSRITDPLTVWSARRDNLMRLPGTLGHSLTPFEDDEALAIANEVNAILATEVYRDLDSDGDPGGVIRIPDDKTAVILGDIHARSENVLRIVTEGGLLSALDKGDTCLVFLGDVVHSQEDGELDDMESSVFILDLFFLLKRRFPANVFYIHGNHESFSSDVGKGGVPQGLLFRKHLKKRRGKAYVSAIEEMFDRLAYVVHGSGFAASHGAPVRTRVDRDALVNIRGYPGLQYELVWNRLRQGNRPAGYSKGSVKRFRQTLGLPKHAPVIVAHTPLSSNETFWLEVGGITGHHVVYSAHTHRAAAFVIGNGKITTLEFVPDQSLAFLNDSGESR